MKIAVSAESTVDLTKELLEKFNIHTLPFTVIMGEEEKLDGVVNADDIIAFVNKTKILAKTSAVNRVQYQEHFSNLKKEYDAIIHFSISSKLSSAYENALSVAKEMENVLVVDTASLSTGIALLAVNASKMVENGCSLDEIYNYSINNREKVQASFVLNRLDYLYKGGRCSSLSYFGANLLKIRPQILLKDGAMKSGNKYRGNMPNIVNKYVQDVLNEFAPINFETVFITYTTCDENIINSVENTLKDFGFKNIYITRAGATITSHCGEECIGILYMMA